MDIPPAELPESDVAGYNYAHFDQHIADGGDARDADWFRVCCGAGGRAPDAALQRLDDGTQVRLSGLWRSQPLVMEFGSFT